MLQKMKKILVVGPKKDFHSVIDVLYDAGTIHLEDVHDQIPSEEISLEKWNEELGEEVLQTGVKLGGIFLTLPKISDDKEAQARIYEGLYWKNHEEILSRSRQILAELETTTSELSTRKSDLDYSITALNRYTVTIERIQPLESQLPVLEGYEATVILILKEYSEVLGLIRDELSRITRGKAEIISADMDENTIAAIMVFNKRYSDQIHSLIYSNNVNEIRLPEEYLGKPFDEVLVLIREKKDRANAELKAIDEEMERLSADWYQELAVLRVVLEEKYREISAFSRFGRSAYTFVIMGWIPEKSLQETGDLLKEKFGEMVVVHELLLKKEEFENAPTLYDNPKIVQPFEIIMGLVSPPKYSEIDPSPLLAFFFPFFFGMMVGDIGYGIAIAVIAIIVKRRYSMYSWLISLMNIMLISSVPTIIFGYLYGEFFGDLGEMMGWLHPVHFLGITWNRMEAIMPMLIFAIAIGVVHVVLGLILGIINAVSSRNRAHAIEKTGTLVLITGGILIAGYVGGVLPSLVTVPAITLMIIALPMIVYGGGVMGPIEIMSTIGNIMSYARLMAIGMASVILAVVANQLGAAIGIAVIGVIVAVLLHALNIALAMFSPALHSIRLHVVECYSKFYEGGGRYYDPFKKRDDG